MNKVILMGRLTRDPETRFTAEGKSVSRYTLAVDRRQNGETTADFINCVAFSRASEFADKYLQKGTKVLITGNIHTGSYTKQDGTKVYTTDIYIESQEFAESRRVAEENPVNPRPVVDADGFAMIPDGVIDEQLPFN